MQNLLKIIVINWLSLKSAVGISQLIFRNIYTPHNLLTWNGIKKKNSIGRNNRRIIHWEELCDNGLVWTVKKKVEKVKEENNNNNNNNMYEKREKINNGFRCMED